MKVPPLNLTPDMNRSCPTTTGGPIPTLPFGHELLRWSYPAAAAAAISFQPSGASAPPPPSPLMDVKSQFDVKTLPTHLSLDPRVWCRDDVVSFLRWVEREYDLPTIDHTKFCMNGKALMMLNKADLTERAPDAGDILHNTLQQILTQSSHIPPSPLTPHHPMLSPSPLATSTSANVNPTQTWGLMQAADFHNLSHLLQQNSSVTLSPAHSEQSGGSPRHPDNASTASNGSAPGYPHSGGQSDSEDSTRDSNSPQRSPIPPQLHAQPAFSVQALASIKQLSNYQRAAAAAAAAASAVQQSKHQEDSAAHYKQQIQQALQLQQQQQHSSQPALHHHVTHLTSHQQTRSSPPLGSLASSTASPSASSTTTPSSQPSQPQNSSPDEPVEPGTNGRLLWDFLQQLLNDREQRYNRYIAWRNPDTGVFKIVDPPGLARLWGIQKNHLSMNYDKMSRALRYYYRVNILRKVQGERHCYQFLRNPSELRNIKNISSLKMAALPTRTQQNNQQTQQQQQQQQQVQQQQALHLQQQQAAVVAAASVHHQLQQIHDQHHQLHQEQDDEGPTDLSMSSLHHNLHHNSSNSSSPSPTSSNNNQNNLDRSAGRRPSSPQDMTIEEHYIKMEDDEAISVDYVEE